MLLVASAACQTSGQTSQFLRLFQNLLSRRNSDLSEDNAIMARFFTRLEQLEEEPAEGRNIDSDFPLVQEPLAEAEKNKHEHEQNSVHDHWATSKHSHSHAEVTLGHGDHVHVHNAHVHVLLEM